MESPAIHLRPYQSSDFETLYQIDQECFSRGIAYGRLELKFYLRSKSSYCLLAEISGDVVGFILTKRSGGLAHVTTLDILEPYRRRKIGSMLLEAAEREAATQGSFRMILETATTNKPAIALWKKHGYCESATIENYYGPGLDAFEMEKPLRRRPEET